MTKNELVELVDRVYATWNQVLPQSSAKVIYEAWWRLLSDLDLETCHRVVDSLAISDNYMPRPGGLRKLTLVQYSQSSASFEPAPSALEAWSIVRGLSEASANGEYIQVSLHKCVSEALRVLGGTRALGLHTNGDRTSFIEVYNTVLASWENELAKLPSNK